MFKNVLNKVVEIGQKYGSYSLPLRFIIGAILTLAAGSGIGFFAEYAAYRYALYYGIRPPLEGIPYLRVAITSLTVGVLLLAALIFTLIKLVCYSLLSWCNNWVVNTKWSIHIARRLVPNQASEKELSNYTDAMIEAYRKLPFWKALLLALGLSTFISIPAIIFSLIGIDDWDWSTLPLILVCVFITALLFWKEQVSIWLSFIGVTATIIIIPMSLFSVTIYGNLLQILGYGGGLPVTVIVAEETSNIEKKTRIDGALMLRTTSVLILFESKKKRVLEIPLEKVLLMEYPATLQTEQVIQQQNDNY